METGPRSPAETLKESSRGLRGSIAEELQLPTPQFSKESSALLKFHGLYPQSDRDARKAGQPPLPGTMVRVQVPGGVLSTAQYLVLDSLADEAGDGSLRITTRQDIQFHRVRKPDLKRLQQRLNESLLSTFAACGDVVRNVVCCPAPIHDDLRGELQRYTRELSRRLKPATRAYYEIWLDGEKAASAEAEPEPLYGSTYLPRKFKIGFAAPGENCIDVYTNDVGIIPVLDGGRLRAFTFVAGGGMGSSPGVKASHPRLASPVCTAPPEDLTAIAEAAIAIHRDYGNRSNRRLARLKYVIDDWGLERFIQELETRLDKPLTPPETTNWYTSADHLGWQEQGDGRWFIGVPVESGRIRDNGAALRSGLREAIQRFQPGVRLTPQQNILLTDIAESDRAALADLLAGHGIRPAEQLPPVLRDALACPALPTCGLAITEAERALPEVAAEIHRTLCELGLGGESISVRMTGCPNACARPQTAEIGLVGESVDLYGVYLGASHLGTRLGSRYRAAVPRTGIAASLRPVFEAFRGGRLPGESFGDFCNRRAESLP